MASFNPIAVGKALELIASARLGDDPAKVIADYAEVGLVKGYARLIETVTAEGHRNEVRDGKISREVWRRIIDENRANDIAAARTVRLPGSGLRGGASEVNVTGILFDEKSIRSVLARHSHGLGASSELRAVPAEIVVAGPRQQSAALVPVGVEPVACAKPDVTYDATAPAYSINEAAKILNVCRATINNHIRKGKLPWSKVGGRTLVGGDGVRALLPSVIGK